MQVGTTKDQGLYNKPSVAVHPGALAAGTLPQYNKNTRAHDLVSLKYLLLSHYRSRKSGCQMRSSKKCHIVKVCQYYNCTLSLSAVKIYVSKITSEENRMEVIL